MTNETRAKQHTPGPWHIGMKPGPMIYGPKGEQVADLSACMVTDDETVGNGKLIARAPSLLAENESLRQQNAELVRVLQFALDSFDPQTEAFSQPRRKPLLQMIRAILATVQS